jgi:FYVE zinc finger
VTFLMDFFTSYRSKKTSETGNWANDEEVDNCFCCGVKFNFIIRKHHCRVSSVSNLRVSLFLMGLSFCRSRFV